MVPTLSRLITALREIKADAMPFGLPLLISALDRIEDRLEELEKVAHARPVFVPRQKQLVYCYQIEEKARGEIERLREVVQSAQRALGISENHSLAPAIERLKESLTDAEIEAERDDALNRAEAFQVELKSARGTIETLRKHNAGYLRIRQKDAERIVMFTKELAGAEIARLKRDVTAALAKAERFRASRVNFDRARHALRTEMDRALAVLDPSAPRSDNDGGPADLVEIATNVVVCWRDESRKLERAERERDEVQGRASDHEHNSTQQFHRAEKAKADLATNAALLAKQCDLARAAETRAAEAERARDEWKRRSVEDETHSLELLTRAKKAERERDAYRDNQANARTKMEALGNLIYRIGDSIGDEVTLKRSTVCSEIKKIMDCAALAATPPDGGV